MADRRAHFGWIALAGMSLGAGGLAGGLAGCTPVKPYQRAYLNDERMQTGQRLSAKPAASVHNYREGSTGGGGGTVSGGCGCN